MFGRYVNFVLVDICEKVHYKHNLKDFKIIVSFLFWRYFSSWKWHFCILKRDGSVVTVIDFTLLNHSDASCILRQKLNRLNIPEISFNRSCKFATFYFVLYLPQLSRVSHKTKIIYGFQVPNVTLRRWVFALLTRVMSRHSVQTNSHQWLQLKKRAIYHKSAKAYSQKVWALFFIH